MLRREKAYHDLLLTPPWDIRCDSVLNDPKAAKEMLYCVVTSTNGGNAKQESHDKICQLVA